MGDLDLLEVAVEGRQIRLVAEDLQEDFKHAVGLDLGPAKGDAELLKAFLV